MPPAAGNRFERSKHSDFPRLLSRAHFLVQVKGKVGVHPLIILDTELGRNGRELMKWDPSSLCGRRSLLG